jgi:hypothetical protein
MQFTRFNQVATNVVIEGGVQVLENNPADYPAADTAYNEPSRDEE